MFDNPLTTLTLHNQTHLYYTQSNLQENPRYIEIYNVLKVKILEYLQITLIMTKKLFTLIGKNFAINNHISVLVTNLYKTITGQ